MAEAPITLAQAKARTKAEAQLRAIRATLTTAARVRALQVAMGHVKRRLQAQGLRVSQFSRRELVTHAEQYLAEHREALIADAKQTVEQWRLEGFFGRRARQNTTRYTALAEGRFKGFWRD